MGYTTTKDDRNDNKSDSSHWLHPNPLPINARAFIIKRRTYANAVVATQPSEG